MEEQPQTSEVHAFMEQQHSLADEVEAILLAPQLLTEEETRNLICILQDYMPSDVAYGADFDLAAEVSHQLTAIRAMRRKVMTDSGLPMDDVTARDLKEVATASNTLLGTLLKAHEKIMNFERLRAVEKAVVTTLKTLPQDIQDMYLERLDTELQAIK